MSDSVETPTNAVDPQSSWKSVSYADDFHSAGSQPESHEATPAEAGPASSPPQAGQERNQLASKEVKTWYSYLDSATSTCICIYAPGFPLNPDDAIIESKGQDVGKVGNRLPSSRSRGSTVGDTVVSYSSNFEVADSETSTRSQASPDHSRSSTASSTGSSGASYLRVMSFDQLTTAEDRYAEDACERLTRRATLTSSSPPPISQPAQPPLQPIPAPQSKAMEQTARALLRRLRTAEPSRPGLGETQPASQNPYLQLAGVPTSLEVSSLAVERLRVESLRQGIRLLAAGGSHEPRSCPECLRELERLAEADRLRTLTRQVTRHTVETRLTEHQPACVMSREMLNVARNARLVSEWMRTGLVPTAKGFS